MDILAETGDITDEGMMIVASALDLYIYKIHAVRSELHAVIWPRGIGTPRHMRIPGDHRRVPPNQEVQCTVETDDQPEPHIQ